MIRRSIAVAHYVCAPGHTRLKRGIKWVPSKSNRRKRRLFHTWKEAQRYAQDMSDRTRLGWVYRLGCKPARIWQWSIN